MIRLDYVYFLSDKSGKTEVKSVECSNQDKLAKNG